MKTNIYFFLYNEKLEEWINFQGYEIPRIGDTILVKNEYYVIEDYRREWSLTGTLFEMSVDLVRRDV